jgi:hypothetical protein
MTQKPGTVAVCCGEHARWSNFSKALEQLHKPEGTQVHYEIGPRIDENRNNAVAHAIKTGAAWIYFLDDDMYPRPDTLERLLEHNVDVVAGLAVQRSNITKAEAFVDFDNTPAPLTLAPVLQTVAAVGAGTMLVRLNVFKAFPPPWFEFTPRTGKAPLGEDITFCRKATDAGHTIHCDYSTDVATFAKAIVWPSVIEQARTNVRVGRNVASIVPE